MEMYLQRSSISKPFVKSSRIFDDSVSIVAVEESMEFTSRRARFTISLIIARYRSCCMLFRADDSEILQFTKEASYEGMPCEPGRTQG